MLIIFNWFLLYFIFTNIILLLIDWLFIIFKHLLAKNGMILRKDSSHSQLPCLRWIYNIWIVHLYCIILQKIQTKVSYFALHFVFLILYLHAFMLANDRGCKLILSKELIFNIYRVFILFRRVDKLLSLFYFTRLWFFCCILIETIVTQWERLIIFKFNYGFIVWICLLWFNKLLKFLD